jgi:hypothetical protein
MNQRTFALVCAVVFLLIALAHVVRVVLQSSVIVQGFSVPMWASVVAAVFMAYLSFEGFRLARTVRG